MIELKKEEFSAGKKVEERTIAELLEYGIVVLDKPCGPSSHEASAFVKRILNAKKTGHTGTLDPEVSGVLPVLLNEACKTSKYFLEGEKEYVCLMRVEEKEKAGVEELRSAFDYFTGRIYQVPPIKSAVSKNLRIRRIYENKILEIDGSSVLFSSRVQAGTYIRKLCFHVGEYLGCGASMQELRRIRAAGIPEEKAVTLQALSDAFWLWREKGDESEMRKIVVPVESLIKLKRVVASDSALKSICSGANLAIPGVLSIDDGFDEGDFVQVLTGKGELVCIARALKSSKEIVSVSRGDGHGMAFDIERVVHSFK